MQLSFNLDLCMTLTFSRRELRLSAMHMQKVKVKGQFIRETERETEFNKWMDERTRPITLSSPQTWSRQ